MGKEVNEYLIRISGGAIPIMHKLELGDDVVIGLKGTVTKIEAKDNQDGKYDQLHIIKGVMAYVQTEEGEIQVRSDLRETNKVQRGNAGEGSPIY